MIILHKYWSQFVHEDKIAIVLQDMQTFLRSTQKKRKENDTQTIKQIGENVKLDYDAFPLNRRIGQKMKRIRNTTSSNSIKRGCQRCFVANKIVVPIDLGEHRVFECFGRALPWDHVVWNQVCPWCRLV